MANWRFFVLRNDALALLNGTAVKITEPIWTLIGCLAFTPDLSMSRRQVASLLWPDSGEDAARRCLATLLWRTKSKLPCLNQILKVGDERIELQLDSRIWIDALALDQRANKALVDPQTLASAQNRRKLRSMLSQYKGEFLSKLDCDMVLIERERLRALFLDASFQLAFTCTHHGEWQEALEILRTLCAVEPLREDAQRLLIEAYAACGNRALAIQQYKSLEALLARELAVSPMAETTEAIVRIASDVAACQPAQETANRHLLLQVRAQVAATMSLIDRALAHMPP
jgi:DNA-binding SARP family transcriptional activator